MNCYCLMDGAVQEGIPAEHFPLAEDPSGDRVRQAVIDVEVDTPVEAFLRQAKMVTWEEPYLFAYGVALLRPLDGLPGTRRRQALGKIEPYMPDGSLLADVDLSRVYGQKDSGDRSLLVSWRGTRGLLLCLPAATGLMDVPTGKLFVNRAGVLLPEPRFREVLVKHDRRQRQLRLSSGRTRLLGREE